MMLLLTEGKFRIFCSFTAIDIFNIYMEANMDWWIIIAVECSEKVICSITVLHMNFLLSTKHILLLLRIEKFHFYNYMYNFYIVYKLTVTVYPTKCVTSF